MTIFEETGRRKTKMNITFSVGNGVTNTVFKFFPQKTPRRLNEIRKNRFWEHIFSYISGSIQPISKNNWVHPWVSTHQSYEFHENRLKTAA